jgi:hypothetical protein
LTSANGNDHELGSFVQSYGSKWLDGSLLLLPTTVFCASAVRFAETIGAATGGASNTFDAFHVIRFMTS